MNIRFQTDAAAKGTHWASAGNVSKHSAMKNLPIVFVIVIIVYSCNFIGEGEVSEKLNFTKDTNSMNEDLILQMIDGSNIKPSNELIIEGAMFSVVIDNDFDTIHWSTNDPEFITPEGYHFGTSLYEIPTESKEAIEYIPGWGYYLPLNSGWKLGFCEGSTCTETEPSEKSKVKWIFKRKILG